MAQPASDAARLLADLVGFETVSSNPNRDLIQFIADYLQGLGVEARVTYDEAGAKADLSATLGPMRAGGVVLSGHTDVVPATGQDWSTPPFTLTERDGRLHGRGSADMKGFIACVLAQVPDFLARGLKRPIHLAFSYDEEVGCLNAPDLIRRLVHDVPAPLAAIIGEPTAMKLVNAHKGLYGFTTTITGRPVHSSNPALGVNAIQAAARCVTFLGDLGAELAGRRTAEGFDPPHTTINLGEIAGGTAVNIVAEHCRFVWDCRIVAAAEADEVSTRFQAFSDGLAAEMRRVAPEAGIETENFCAAPPLLPAEASPAEALVRGLTGQNRAGTTSMVTEAGLFALAEIPAAIIGPGDPARAHRAGEYITPAELAECTAFLAKLGDWAAADGDSLSGR